MDRGEYGHQKNAKADEKVKSLKFAFFLTSIVRNVIKHS